MPVVLLLVVLVLLLGFGEYVNFEHSSGLFCTIYWASRQSNWLKLLLLLVVLVLEELLLVG